MDDRKLSLMGCAPVRSAIIRLAVPTMLAAVVQILYNLTDTLFIGMLGDSDLVAAISLVMPVVFAVTAFGNIFGVGTASYISRQLGARNMKEARHANAVGAYSAAAVGTLLMAAMLIFKEPIVGAIGSSPATYGPAAEYFTIISGFSPVLILQVALAGLVRSEGATSKAMWGMIIGLLTNIVLDPVFIFTFGLGIAGAAWATVIGNALGVGFYILHFLKGRTVLSINLKDFRPTRRIYAQSLEIGVPASLSMLIMSVSFVFGNVLAQGYGDKVVAGFGICQRVMGMCIMLIAGMSQGYQPFAGFNYGAKQFDRLKSGLKVTMTYNIILGFVSMVLFLIFAREIAGLFIKGDPETVEAGQKFVRAFAIGMPFVGLQFTLMVTFQATGKALRAMLISLGRQALVFLPLLFLLDHLFGLNGLIYAQPAADIISAGAAALMSISFIRQLRTMHNEQHCRAEKPETDLV